MKKNKETAKPEVKETKLAEEEARICSKCHEEFKTRKKWQNTCDACN